MKPEIKKTLLGSYNVKFDCPACSSRLTSPLVDAGRNDSCPDCNAKFTVPGAKALAHWKEEQAAEAALKREKSERKAAERQAADDAKRRKAEELALAEREAIAEDDRRKTEELACKTGEPAASVSPTGPVYTMRGVQDLLEVFEDRVAISPKGFMGFMNKGLKGTKEIPFTSVVAVQFKEAGAVFSGYLQFTIPGGNESKGGLCRRRLENVAPGGRKT
jgi:hypothetical protein